MDFADLVSGMNTAVIANLGGPAITYTPTIGKALTVPGIFSKEYLKLDVGEAGVSSSTPNVFFKVADLPVDPEADDDPTVTVDGVDYGVSETKPDGLGGVLLLLHKR